MPPRDFDALVRQIARPGSRRDALRLGVAALAGGLVLAERQPAAAKGCGPCRVKKRKKCKGNKPDGTACNDTGQCFEGACVAKPACDVTGVACTQAGASSCCSGVCREDAHCQNSAIGGSCLSQADCAFGTCVAYVCRQ